MTEKAEMNTLSEEISRITQSNITDICEELSTVWLELWDEDERNDRKRKLAEECGSTLLEFLQAVLVSELKSRDEYIERVEKLMEEINFLQKHLKVTIDHDHAEELPLHTIATILNKRVKKYRVIREERMKTLYDLQLREKNLLETLGMIPNDIKFSEIPTEEQLEKLSLHVQSLENEKCYRRSVFNEKRMMIKDMFENLEIKPNLKFEKELLSDNYENIKLNNENMMHLNSVETKLKQQTADAMETAHDLIQKLKNLWVYLDETEEKRSYFLSTHTGHSSSTIAKLRSEVDRCEAKKRENISEIVVRVRKVLVDEWDKCLVSEDERKHCHFFNSNCYTEDLCELHELEIERLRKFYQTNELIYQLISKRQKLFNNLLDLEKRAKNFDRYYNRGGQLLQEEKERKKIKKDLPRIEEDLKNLLRKYKEENGKPFTSYGKPVEDIIEEQWANHLGGKTMEKNSRKNGVEQKVGSAVKRAFPTPTSITTCSAKKIGRYACENKGTSGKKKPGSTKTTPRNVTVRRNCFKNCVDVETSFQIRQTYEEFENVLQSKAENVKRSTSVTDLCTPVRTVAVLKEQNTPRNGHFLRSVNTPARSTPVKISTPQWTPVNMRTPKTFPRTARVTREVTPRGKSPSHQPPRFTTARNKLPIII